MADKIQRGTSSNLLQDDKLKIQTQFVLPEGDDFTDNETASIKLKTNGKLAYQNSSAGIVEIATQSALDAESNRAIAVEATKVNTSDIINDITIAFGDSKLSGTTYTDISLANKTVQIAYTDLSNVVHLPFITFNSSGAATLPFVPVSGNAQTNITIRGNTGTFAELSALQNQLNKIPYKYYDFTGFNTANIVGSSAVALLSTYAVTSEGLEIAYGVSTTGRTAWYSNLGVDNSKDYYAVSLTTKVVSFNAGATLGFAFGLYGTNLFSVGYHENGSLTTNINDSIANIRPATPGYAFLAGDTIGLNFIVDKATGVIKDIKTVLNGVISNDTFSINVTNFTNFYLYRRTRSTSRTIITVNQLATQTITQPTVFYVNGETGSDSNKGTVSAPFKTMNKAFSSCVGLIYSKIIVIGGAFAPYRESWTLSIFTFETVEVIARTPDVVQMFGSNAVTGWSKTSGKTNVYQAAFTGTILAGDTMGKFIYEHGNPSKQVLSNERNAWQKNLSYRLPFTPLVPVTSIDLCDSTQGSFFQDTVNNLLYIHSGNSSSPLTNGFSYENIARTAVTVANSSFDPSRKATIILKNIQFLYNQTGVKLNGFARVERYMCTALASLGTGGFIDDAPFIIAYRDETGFSDGDGSQGHYNVVSGYATQDQREGVQQGWYTDIWCHDNFDDGLSFHERADITINGGLFEYNGDGGVRQAADANIRISNALARKNGWDISAGTSGSGFDCTNSPSANRNTGSLTLINCHSEGNRKGIAILTGGATLDAYNCSTRNNTQAEYYAETGVLNANNCKATNSDSTKIKVITGSGVINVKNDTNLI